MSARSRHLNCPRCGLSILVQPQRAAIRHCPRCVGRSQLIVELFSSTLPADMLYDENSLPRVDGDPVRSDTAASSVSIPKLGGRHQRAQAVDKLRRTEPLALVTKRPMAIPTSAIDERAASPRARPRLASCPSCSPAGRAGRAHPRIGSLTQGMAIPRRHLGTEVAYALLIQRECAAPERLSSAPRTPVDVAGPGHLDISFLQICDELDASTRFENETHRVTSGNDRDGQSDSCVYCLTES